jgi:hypothetical protein
MPQRHRPELSDSVAADPLGTYRGTPRTFSPGRCCAEPGCTTVLSIYNGAKHCAAHNPKQRRVSRPPTPRPAAGEPLPLDADAGRAGAWVSESFPRRLVPQAAEEVRQQAS